MTNPRISKLLAGHGSDKITPHLYGGIYDELFQQCPRYPTLLEIGCDQGRSARAWVDYGAKVYMVDRERCPPVDGVFFTRMDAGKRRSWKEFLESYPHTYFDIIIDDGGHAMDQHQISLAMLMDRVILNGFYVIEDLETCSFDPSALVYGSSLMTTKDGRSSTKRLLEDLGEGRELNSPFMTIEECDKLSRQFEVYKFGGHQNEMAVLRRKVLL